MHAASDRRSVRSLLRRGAFAVCFLFVYACVVAPLVTLVRLGHAVGLLSNATADRDKPEHS